MSSGATFATLQRTMNQLAVKEGKLVRQWVAWKLCHAQIFIGLEGWTDTGYEASGKATIDFKATWWEQGLEPFIRGAVTRCPDLLGHCLEIIHAGGKEIRGRTRKLHWRIELDGDLEFDATGEQLTFPLRISGAEAGEAEPLTT